MRDKIKGKLKIKKAKGTRSKKLKGQDSKAKGSTRSKKLKGQD